MSRRRVGVDVYLNIVLFAEKQEPIKHAEYSAHGVKQDNNVLFRLNPKVAEAPYADYLYLKGVNYSLGLGVEQDDVEAVKWFQEAAAAGSVKAMTSLGESYEKGIDVEQNPEEAESWREKAQTMKVVYPKDFDEEPTDQQ